MKKNLRVQAALGILLAFAAGRAWAQTKQGDNILGLSLGIGLPVSEINPPAVGGGDQRPGDAGLAAGGQFIHHVTEHWGVGGEISRMGFRDRDFAPPAVTIRSSLMTFEGVARYLFTPQNPISPYVIGGFGLNRFAAHAHDTGDPGDVRLDNDSVGPELSMGAGVEGTVSRNVVLGAEMRYRAAGIDSDKFGASWVQALGFLARAGWKF